MKSISHDVEKTPPKGLVWGCLRINPPAGFKVGMSEENTNENLFIFNFVKKPLDVWSNFSNFLVTNMKYYSKIWIVQILGRVLGKFGLNSQFAPWNRESDPITPFQCKVPPPLGPPQVHLDPQGSEGDPEWFFVTPETYLTTFVSETFWLDEIWFWHPQAPHPHPGCPQGSEGDPEWIFVTLETYLTTFVSKTFWFDEIWFWHPQGPPIAPAAPRGQGVIPNAFLSSLKHTWQLLLATFFDLMKFEFEPLRGSPECPRAPRGRGSNLNSLCCAPMHEGLTLSIWLGYYKRFPRSFAT